MSRTRRAFLKSLAGAGATVGVGYGGSFAASRRGRVVVRHVSGRLVDDGRSRIADIYHAELNRDGTTDREVHPDYRDLIDGATIPADLGSTLQDRFTSVRYYLGHDCAGCSTPAVSRREFNATRLGDRVRLLYHGDGATVVPAPTVV